jgi:hypothetical protein
MDNFRAFVNTHPLLREDVRSGKSTWQNIYEEWVLYGDNNQQWNQYKEQPVKEEKASNGFNVDSLKNIFGYVQKLNPDSVNRTLNTVQKVIQIAQTVGGSKSTKAVAPLAKSMYSDWWD